MPTWLGIQRGNWLFYLFQQQHGNFVIYLKYKGSMFIFKICKQKKRIWKHWKWVFQKALDIRENKFDCFSFRCKHSGLLWEPHWEYVIAAATNSLYSFFNDFNFNIQSMYKILGIQYFPNMGPERHSDILSYRKTII